MISSKDQEEDPANVMVTIPKAMIDDIQKRAWFKYYRDIEDFVLNAMRRSIENWEKCALAYETGEEPDAKVEAVERLRPMSPIKKTEILQDNKPSGCTYYIGYLGKEHPKKTPIPNGCVTCNKINECLFGVE